MLWDFFLIVLKIGSLSYGGGYAMISTLHYELVTHYAWMTETEFTSAVAVGQITPGPLMIMVAFMGYRIAGLAGAVLGTTGLFLPSALIVIAVAGSYMRLKDAPIIVGMMRSLNLAVVGLLAALVIDLARGAMTDPIDMLFGALAFVAAGPLKCDPIVVIACAGLAGLARYSFSI